MFKKETTRVILGRRSAGVRKRLGTHFGQVAAEVARLWTFVVGAALPLATAFISPATWTPIIASITALGFLAVLGSVSAQVGGAPVKKAMARVTCWGALAMAATAGVGALFGVAA